VKYGKNDLTIALLLRAAPDLLEAGKALANLVSNSGYSYHPSLAAMIAAIEKAEGKQPWKVLMLIIIMMATPVQPTQRIFPI